MDAEGKEVEVAEVVNNWIQGRQGKVLRQLGGNVYFVDSPGEFSWVREN
jgi:hypothetical protein